MQGLSLGWADEIEGVAGGVGYGVASMNPKWNKNNESFSEAYNRGYTKYRDERREHVKEGYDKAPIITEAGEITGAIASPIKFTKTAKTAPLGVKARKNIVEAVASGGVYGAGVSEGGASNYVGNIATSIAGNLTGNAISNKTFGRAGVPISRKVVGETVNKGANKAKNILEEKKSNKRK